MVITYLENIYSELMEEKIKLEQRQSDILSKMNERLKYLEHLKKEDEKNYDAFSPRKQNSDLRKQIRMVEKEQNTFNKYLDEKKKEILEINSKIDELSSVIRIAKQQDATSEKIIENSLDENEIFKLKLLETQELERQRIARELHDSTVQSLTGMAFKTELCTKLIDLDPYRCRLEILSMSKALKRLITEMRQMIYDLHPMPMDDIGFDTVIENELFKIEQKSVISTKFSVEGNPYQLKPVVVLTLNRVILEAFNNVLKHADASMLSVKLCYKKNKFKIIISDNGKGFSLEEKQGEIKDDNSGFGLSTMKERIYLLSGKLDISTKVGKGTRITVEVPTNGEE
ncbi:MAG: histidine kinase [Roseburia sp.]|nr:histidine kinase [Roseburia sp.]